MSDESFETIINEIETRIAPTGLARHLGFMPKRGWISCPFHEGSKLSMRCDDEDASFHCRSERCSMYRRRVDLVDFYSQVRDRTFTQAVEELRTLEIRIPDLGRLAPSSKGFDSPDALLEFLKKSQPDYELMATHVWQSVSGTAQKIVYRFKLRLDRARDREQVLIFQTWLFRKKWFRVCHSKSQDHLPYNWANAKASQRIVVARDENEADMVYEAGFSAVALSSIGAWDCPNPDLFIRKDIILLLDPGAEGREHLGLAKADLMKAADSLRPLEIPRLDRQPLPSDRLQELIDNADDVIRPWPKPQCTLQSFELIPDFMAEDMLPESLRYHLEEQAEELQVPLSSLAASSIAGLAALIGEKVTMQPKRHNPAFRVAAPIWSILVGDPGQKKTQVLKVALEPLLAIEKKLAKENQKLVAERSAEMKAIALKERDLEGRLGPVQKSGDTETADAIIRDLANLHLQRTEAARKGSKQIIVREATPEKLLEILV
ncbi:MAG: YfjI family protein, partial [Pseudobdellovibrionaceae bacterium]|nr:YfjI family protein [Pseudobdellovibrionaceae bacterium]